MVLVMRALTKKWLLAVALVATAAGSGCKESSDLEWTQNRSGSAIDGQFLTKDPDSITFPVKILFALDFSLSMGENNNGTLTGSDPTFQRVNAVKNFVDEYNTLDNVSFEIMYWSDSVFDVTRNEDGEPGFTKNQASFDTIFTVNDDSNVAQTNYLGTLSQIYVDIQNDIQNTRASDLKRSKYIVVFLSDGQPLNNGAQQDKDDIVKRVTEIKEMTELAKVGGFAFHTYLLDAFGNDDASIKEKSNAIDILQTMATAGEGNYHPFTNADAISFISTVDLRLAVEYLLRYVIAYNVNTIPGTETIALDSDGDGLSDERELLYGSYPWCRDSDNDGVSDFVEYKLTTPTHVFNPLTGIADPDGDGPMDKDTEDNNCTVGVNGTWPDTDGDLLNDCEESMIGTDRREADTDNDGIPDGLEFMAGTNHLIAEETTDSDIDGISNPIEIRNHTNVNSDDAKLRERYSYEYLLIDHGKVKIDQGEGDDIVQSIRRRYTLDVKNIDLMEVGINPITNKPYDTTGQSCVDYVEGENTVYVYLSEVPGDDPSSTSFVSKTEFKVNIDSDKNPSGNKVMEFHSNGLENSKSSIFSQIMNELN